MKRDMDLVRRILKDLSEASGPLNASAFVDEVTTFDEVCYHFRIMDEAGLIKATVTYAGNAPYFAVASELTWEGNDFLASVESDTIWNKVKSRVAKATGDASFSVFKAVAVKMTEAAVLAGM